MVLLLCRPLQIHERPRLQRVSHPMQCRAELLPLLGIRIDRRWAATVARLVGGSHLSSMAVSRRWDR